MLDLKIFSRKLGLQDVEVGRLSGKSHMVYVFAPTEYVFDPRFCRNIARELRSSERLVSVNWGKYVFANCVIFSLIIARRWVE